MKAIERVLIKLIIIQFLFLIASQIFIHELDVFPEIKQLTEYEGVGKDNFTEVLETFRGERK